MIWHGSCNILNHRLLEKVLVNKLVKESKEDRRDCGLLCFSAHFIRNT